MLIAMTMKDLIKNTNDRYRIYLDMDNVITDFNNACNSICPGLIELHQTDKDEFWKIIESRGITFWSEMPWKIDGRELIHYLLNYKTTILSAHPNPKRGILTDFSKKGKIKWLSREISGDFARQAIICRRSDKTSYANPTSILVDDNEENILNWQNAGGIGILHTDAERSIERLQNILSNSYNI